MSSDALLLVKNVKKNSSRYSYDFEFFENIVIITAPETVLLDIGFISVERGGIRVHRL